jgi:hypothetical protein
VESVLLAYLLTLETNPERYNIGFLVLIIALMVEALLISLIVARLGDSSPDPRLIHPGL